MIEANNGTVEICKELKIDRETLRRWLSVEGTENLIQKLNSNNKTNQARLLSLQRKGVKKKMTERMRQSIKKNFSNLSSEVIARRNVSIRKSKESKEFRDRLSLALRHFYSTPEGQLSGKKRGEKTRGHPCYHPKGETSIERKVREFFESNKIAFVQQRYFPKIGTVDFFVEDAGVVFECDGDFWHGSSRQKQVDQWKDRALAIKSIQVVRLPEKEIVHNFNAVENEIRSALALDFGNRRGV